MRAEKGSTYVPLLNTRKKAIALAVALAVTAVLTLIYFAFAERQVSLIFPDCLLREATGLRCVICGGTRCLRELFGFNFAKAFYYNPYVIIVGLSAAVWYILLVASLLKREYKPLRMREGYLWAVLIGAVLFTVLRNFGFYKSIFY